MNSWHVFGASVRGPQHERESLPCQDAWAWGPTGERGAIVCLCDGAGSAAHAEIGAGTVAGAVVKAFRDLDTVTSNTVGDALRGAVTAGRQALFDEAASRQVAPSALACTLVAVAIAGDRIAVAHIGDGAVVGQHEGSGELLILSPPDRGEYAGETWFVTSASWQERLRISVHDGIKAFSALTDGCQSASLVQGRTMSPFTPFWAPLFAFAAKIDDAHDANAQVARLLDTEMLRRSSGDDKTLAIAHRRAAP